MLRHLVNQGDWGVPLGHQSRLRSEPNRDQKSFANIDLLPLEQLKDFFDQRATLLSPICFLAVRDP